jgi:hypothetical protein
LRKQVKVKLNFFSGNNVKSEIRAETNKWNQKSFSRRTSEIEWLNYVSVGDISFEFFFFKSN